MQKRSLGALMSVTALMVVLATVALATAPSGTGPAAPGADERALPGLAARLNDVALVEVKRSGLDLTFIRDGNAWLTEQKSKYPADAGKVRRIVLALSDMTLVEPKTGEPSLYPRLQVEDPGDGKSTLVTIKDKSGNDIARLIVGKYSYDRLGEGNDDGSMSENQAIRVRGWRVVRSTSPTMCRTGSPAGSSTFRITASPKSCLTSLMVRH